MIAGLLPLEHPARTVSLPEVAHRRWDAIVVGAGPAGSLAARQLARGGATVLLVERSRFPRFKVCGCCLNGAALAALRDARLGDLPDRLSAPRLGGVRLATPGGTAQLDYPAGRVLSRAALDSALAEAAIAAGAEFLPGVRAVVGPYLGAKRRVTLAGRQGEFAAEAAMVVVADGLAGQSLRRWSDLAPRVADASRFGLGTTVEDASHVYAGGTIVMACGTGGYVGLVRLENDRLNIGAALDRDEIRRWGSPAAAVVAVLRQAGQPVPAGLDTAAWQGTVALSRRRRRVSAARLMIVGDSAGYAEPFTGEGLAWALLGGLAAAPLVARGIESWDDSLAVRWEVRYRRTIARRQRLCRTLGAALRYPRLVSLAARVLAWSPSLAGPWLRAINRPPRPVSPAAVLRVPG